MGHGAKNWKDDLKLLNLKCLLSFTSSILMIQMIFSFHCFRRVLEMCCFMEKMLANMLADFEMKVEKAVLEPLNKLSEVRVAQSTC